MRVYIAGPMGGIPNWNHPLFDEAEKRWKEAGHQPYNPAHIDRALNYPKESETTGQDLRHIMYTDLGCIMFADAIALLPGWENSLGSAVELAFAQFLGIKIFNAITMEEFNPRKKPWAI